MCKCTPEIITKYCVKCAFPEHTISLTKIDKIPPVPPLCNLRAFYDAACATLTHNEFLYLVKKAQQNAGV